MYACTHSTYITQSTHCTPVHLYTVYRVYIVYTQVLGGSPGQSQHHLPAHPGAAKAKSEVIHRSDLRGGLTTGTRGRWRGRRSGGASLSGITIIIAGQSWQTIFFYDSHITSPSTVSPSITSLSIASSSIASPSLSPSFFSFSFLYFFSFFFFFFFFSFSFSYSFSSSHPCYMSPQPLLLFLHQPLQTPASQGLQGLHLPASQVTIQTTYTDYL